MTGDLDNFPSFPRQIMIFEFRTKSLVDTFSTQLSFSNEVAKTEFHIARNVMRCHASFLTGVPELLNRVIFSQRRMLLTLRIVIINVFNFLPEFLVTV